MATKESVIRRAVPAGVIAVGTADDGVTQLYTTAEALADELAVVEWATDAVEPEHSNPNREPEAKYQLPAGAALLLDEAGMVRTSDWARLCALAETNRWRIVAVGDGFQFSAVGRGGMFEHLTTALHAERVTQLDRVHRFVNEWEAAASLAMRTGEAGAIDVYVENNRVAAMPSDGDAVATAVAMWDRYEAEDETFAVFSTSNETVRDLNAAIQRQRGRAGLVSGKGMAQGRHHKLGVGDHVVTRQNDRGLVTDRGHWVRNRETFTIAKIRTTSIVATGSTGTVELPTEYVKDNVDLAYAQTSHAGQGRTVDHSLLVIAEDDTPGRAGIYVPMTRGRKTNRAVVATGTENPDANDAAQIITEALGRRWIDSPAIGEMAETPAEQRAAARAALDHVTAMARRNRAALRRRSHPLHFARKERLTDRYNELFDVLTKPETRPVPMDARADTLERIRQARAQYNRPDPHEPDIGI